MWLFTLLTWIARPRDHPSSTDHIRRLRLPASAGSFLQRLNEDVGERSAAHREIYGDRRISVLFLRA